MLPTLGGFASPAAAKIIVVTTLDDTADSPFDTDGLCGTGTINDLPGNDHLISLREALIAANNTMGADTITFARSLSRSTIEVNFDDLDADPDPDPLLQAPIQLSDKEFTDLVDFVRYGLLDPRILPEQLKTFVPKRVPSGRPTLDFEFE